jgi:tetratricopeptide (TPR) repeat protein
MLADCTNNIARIFAGRGEYALARLRHQEALDLYTQLHMLHAASHQHCHLGMVYHRMGHHRAAENHFEQALALSRTLDDRAFLPQILQEFAELALSMEDYAAAQRYCDECKHILRNADAQQHFYRQAEVTLAVNTLQARLVSVSGDAEQAIQRLDMMLAATDRPVEQAAIHYTRWQLDQDAKSRQQALLLYQQLYTQEPYYRYRQRIEELNASDAS